MWKRILIIMLLPYLSACLNPGDQEPADTSTGNDTVPGQRFAAPDFYLGGIQVNEADHQDWFKALKAQGMNLVQVTEYAYQGDWDSDNLWWDDDDPGVVKEIRGAKAAGLHVVLVLRVYLDDAFERNAFLWHGMIVAKNDQLLASWFEKYTRFCEKWAAVAEREGVDVLMIGSEMNALASTLPVQEVPGLEEYYLNDEKQQQRRQEVLAQKELIEDKNLHLDDSETFESVEEYLEARIKTEQDWASQLTSTQPGQVGAQTLEAINSRRAQLQQYWLRVIQQVRQNYSGPVGYAANFDQYQDVGFWPELDFMGINAYFQLRYNPLLENDTTDPDVLFPMLKAGWASALGQIAEFRAAQGLEKQPVIFTEMGYTFRRLSTLQPWSDTGFSVVYQPDTRADGSHAGEKKHVIVWREQPDDYQERALAIRALHQAHGELEAPFLKGISYWKLSSHDYHKENESFMIHIGEGTDDPALPELRRFIAPNP